ncbi:MAG: MFS transporter [Thermodesulfobacteriota bacterium]
MALTRTEKSWILYDVANSAFVLIVTTTLMPIFFKTHAAREVTPDTATAYWGFTVAASSLLLALLAPFLGALADFEGNKRRFLSWAVAIGVTATLMLSLVRPGQWLLCLALYGLARIGFSGANIFYDAFLVDVTTDERMDRISAYGYGWGYIGSVAPFLAAIALLFLFKSLAAADQFPAPGFSAAFLLTAAWWGLFSIPIFRNVRQAHFTPASSRPLADSLAALITTIRKIGLYKNIALFLLAYFFYIDGVDTIISMSLAYGLDQKLNQTVLIGVVLFIQVLGWPCAIAFGLLAARISAKRMILAGIGVYCLLTFVGYMLPVIEDPGLKVAVFFAMGFLIALAQGGIQSLSRSFFGRMIPKEQAAEFFGFYNIFGKFAAIIGPALMGLTTLATGSSRHGVLSILLLFIAGGVLLCFVREPERP